MQKMTYVKAELKSLGAVRTLTRGFAGSVPDINGTNHPKPPK
jgi:hypothetical protein